MKIDNIIKKLAKEGYVVYESEFDFKKFWFVNGTALVDLKEGCAKNTEGTYKEVIEQIKHNRSHICTIVGKNKELTKNFKIGQSQ